MLEVVATTPSSPLEGCRLATLDMIPRWLCGRIYIALSRKKTIAKATLFYTPRSRQFPSARLAWKSPRRRLGGLLLAAERRASGKSTERFGEIREDKKDNFHHRRRNHPCARNTPGARRRGYVAVRRLPQRPRRDAIWLSSDAGMAGPPPPVVGAF